MATHADVQVSADNVMMTQGGQQAIDLVAKLMLNHGDAMVVEGPTYMGALAAFDTYEPTYYEIPVDDNGMNIRQLRKTLKAHPEIKLIYTIPDFHNPTGTTMSAKRRQALVALANQYDVIILEDSPYRDLRYSGQSIPAIKHYDTEGRVIFISSFSKILSPALRTGWIVADDMIMHRWSDLNPQSMFNHLTSHLLQSTATWISTTSTTTLLPSALHTGLNVTPC